MFLSLFLFLERTYLSYLSAVMVQVPGASRLNDFKNLTLIGKGWPRAVARRAPAVLHSVAGWLPAAATITETVRSKLGD